MNRDGSERRIVAENQGNGEWHRAAFDECLFDAGLAVFLVDHLDAEENSFGVPGFDEDHDALGPVGRHPHQRPDDRRIEAGHNDRDVALLQGPSSFVDLRVGSSNGEGDRKK